MVMHFGSLTFGKLDCCDITNNYVHGITFAH